jgi:mono/diheme cytochrome c family protein
MSIISKSPWLLLAAALTACSANTSTPPTAGTAPAGATAATQSAALGQRLYEGNCVPCHQPNAAGIPGVYPSLVGSPVVLGDPAEFARWVVKGQRPASMPAGRYSTQMLQFGWMQPADAAALLSYLRSNFGNSAPPVEASVVAQALGQ